MNTIDTIYMIGTKAEDKEASLSHEVVRLLFILLIV